MCFPLFSLPFLFSVVFFFPQFYSTPVFSLFLLVPLYFLPLFPLAFSHNFFLFYIFPLFRFYISYLSSFPQWFASPNISLSLFSLFLLSFIFPFFSSLVRFSILFSLLFSFFSLPFSFFLVYSCLCIQYHFIVFSSYSKSNFFLSVFPVSFSRFILLRQRLASLCMHYCEVTIHIRFQTDVLYWP